MKGDHIFLLNGCVQTKEINQWVPYFSVDVCAQRKINKRSYIFVEWLFANERKQSMTTLIFGQMAVH